MISKPIDFNQENTNRGIGPRGPDGRFVKSPSKHQRAMIIDLGHRIGNTTNGHRQPKDARAPHRHNHQEEHTRPRTPKINLRPCQPKYSQHTYTGKQHGPVDNHNVKHDGHGNRPCHRRRL